MNRATLGTLLVCALLSLNTYPIAAESRTAGEVEFGPAQIISELSDNDESKHEDLSVEDGKLRVVATGEGIGWYSDSRGPFLFDTIAGDFMIETEVAIRRKDGQEGLPEAQFSSGGLLVRDPASTYGNESWVVYNVGFQNTFYGHEAKVTRPLAGDRERNPNYDSGFHSLSTLILIPEENLGPAKMRIARVSGEIRFYYEVDGKWHEQTPLAGFEIMGNGAEIPVSQFDKTQLRPDALRLPDSVQVGLMVNPGMDTANPEVLKRDGYALFSYFKTKKIASFEDALK